MNYLKIIFILLCFGSCDNHNTTSKKKTQLLDSLISKSLDEGVLKTPFFGELKYGMPHKEAEVKIKEKSPFKFLNSKEWSFRKTKWSLSGNYHNDTLIGLRLYVYKGPYSEFYGSLNDIYKEAINEYQKKYGISEINFTNETHWLIQNNHIKISKGDKSVTISYIDEHRGSFINLLESKFDEYGNTYSPEYYEIKMKALKILEDSNINGDI